MSSARTARAKTVHVFNSSQVAFHAIALLDILGSSATLTSTRVPRRLAKMVQPVTTQTAHFIANA